METTWRATGVMTMATAGLLALCSAGCGSTSKKGPQAAEETPDLEGFQRFEQLGPACRAAVAEAPAQKYGPLSFIACRSGEPGCQEPDWDGELRWDPTGDGDMLEFSLQASLDGEGQLTRLLITKQYPRSTSISGVPHEAVAYDTETGEPLAAYRNLGDRQPSGSGFGSSGGSYCDIIPLVTQDHVVMLAAPSGGGSVLWGSQRYADAGVPVELAQTELDASVLFAPRFASLGVVGLGDDDGKVVWLDARSGELKWAMGDAQRFWLDAAAGNELLLRDVTGTEHVAFDGVGVEKLAIEGTHLRGDANRFAWLSSSTDGLQVWTVPRDAKSLPEEATLVATLPAAETVTAVTLGGSALAVQAASGSLIAEDTTLYLVNLESGDVLTRSLRSGSGYAVLLANDAEQAWLGRSEGLLLNDEELPTQFETLNRVDLSQGCRGTPTGCEKLHRFACDDLPACGPAPDECSGTPSAVCEASNLSACITTDYCEWDDEAQTCSPEPCTSGLGPTDCEARGCVYTECVPLGCEAVAASECSTQPGCDWKR